ncbi:MAG: MATE family efflux transporter [Halioglobus sp.]|nr:MATE family efflux transporter [Halioglobus sp.]
MSKPSSTKLSSTSQYVWKLAWPTIISHLLFTTVGFAHIKIVAELGTTSVAAVTSGHRVFFFIQAILMGLSVAATALIARAWGAQQVRQAELVSWASIVLSVALAAVLSIPVLLIPETIAGLFGLDEESTQLAARFIFWLGFFYVFAAINMMLGTALRATGDVITPLWFLMFSSTLNVAGAYMLAFGVGGLPQLGVPGVALGGSAGAALITVFFIIFWWRGKFNLKPAKWAPVNVSIARQLVSIGGPAVIEQGIVQLAFLAFFAIVAHYGTSAYAAYGIGISLVAFSIVIGFGFGLATATIVGQQLGAGHKDLAILAATRSLRMALAAMTTLSVLLVWFAGELAAFMIDDPEVIHLTVVFIYMIALAQPLMAFEFTLGGALRGAGDTRFPLIATFCGIILGRLLTALILMSLELSVYWIFSVMLLDYAIKSGLLVYRFRSRKWLDIKIGAAINLTATVDSDKKNT